MTAEFQLIKWQAPMRRVLLALIPLFIEAVYLFGGRVVAMLAIANFAAFVTEYAFTRQWKEPVTSAVLVTGSLYALSLPPGLPFWMTAVGAVFAVAFGKMVFGGFGRNIFNPALCGRAFVYVCFGNYMTSMWHKPVAGRWGGLFAYMPGVDAMTHATPGMLLKTGQTFSLHELFLGSTAGTIGGTGAILAILGGVYLIWQKAANYRIVVPGILGFLGTQWMLWHTGAKGAADPLSAAFAGSFVIGIFFYATDPVSAAQTEAGRWIYGAFVGIMSSLIGVFSAWPAGTMFAILLANMFAPLLDLVIRQLKSGPAPAPVSGGPPQP
jgi:Na+-transporting NADH:ubiquinone oxidoreductase subunit B